MRTQAPIVLFVYNRPDHTQRTLEALEKNFMAEESEVYVYSDGARSEKDILAVKQVRDVIHRTWNFKQVHVIEREKNMGLARNVIDGVTHVIQQYGRVIVLEDDVVTSPHILHYFNDALDRYEHEKKVMHIGAYMYPLAKNNLEETFFTRLTASQAWATWADAWQCFEPDIEKIVVQFDDTKIKDFSFDHTMNFWRQINQQRAGNIDSWAVRWYASVFLNGGLSLQSSTSLITNIGHDGSGVHSSISDMFDTNIKTDKVIYFPDTIEESKLGFALLKNYFRHRKGSLFERGVRWIRNKVSKLGK